MSDYNILWNDTDDAPIHFADRRFDSLFEFQKGTGLDAHSIEADARFVDPAGGDFRVLGSSPAVDSGDASGPYWTWTDARGLRRFDDPLQPNTGSGVIRYADRGANEYNGVPVVPRVELRASAVFPNPSSDGMRLTVTLSKAAVLDWRVHDVQGRQIWREVRPAAPGSTALVWGGKNTAGSTVPPGLYLVRVQAEGTIAARRFVIIR